MFSWSPSPNLASCGLGLHEDINSRRQDREGPCWGLPTTVHSLAQQCTSIPHARCARSLPNSPEAHLIAASTDSVESCHLSQLQVDEAPELYSLAGPPGRLHLQRTCARQPNISVSQRTCECVKKGHKDDLAVCYFSQLSTSPATAHLTREGAHMHLCTYRPVGTPHSAL